MVSALGKLTTTWAKGPRQNVVGPWWGLKPGRRKELSYGRTSYCFYSRKIDR